MVSGTIAPLVGLAFTLAFAPQTQAKPAGYTSDGHAFYRAYPDEGFVEETPPATEPTLGEFSNPDSDLYNETPVDYNNWPWTWWTVGLPEGNRFNFDSKRHFHHFDHRFSNKGFFAHHDFNTGVNGAAVASSQRFAGKSTGAHHSFNGGRHGFRGGGGRHR